MNYSVVFKSGAYLITKIHKLFVHICTQIYTYINKKLLLTVETHILKEK